jgi:hypothetical protein
MQVWYNLFRLASDPKIVGRHDGSQVELDPEKYADPDICNQMIEFFAYANYWDNWNVEKFFPDFKVEFHGNLAPGAKFTDFMNFSPHLMSCNFLVHDRVGEIFSKFHMPPYQLYDASIHTPGNPVNKSYKLFCCPYMNPLHVLPGFLEDNQI